MVVIVRNADEDADVGALLKIEHKSRILNRFPRRLEQQAMLRVDIGRFPRRDAEKLRIELIDAVNKTAAPGNRLADDALLRVVKAFDVPPVWRHVAHRLAALHQ